MSGRTTGFKSTVYFYMRKVNRIMKVYLGAIQYRVMKLSGNWPHFQLFHMQSYKYFIEILKRCGIKESNH